MPNPEPRDRRVIGRLVSRDHPAGDVLHAAALDPSRGALTAHRRRATATPSSPAQTPPEPNRRPDTTHRTPRDPAPPPTPTRTTPSDPPAANPADPAASRTPAHDRTQGSSEASPKCLNLTDPDRPDVCATPATRSRRLPARYRSCSRSRIRDKAAATR